MADNGHHESDERTTDDIFSAYVATELLWSILPVFFFFTDPGLAILYFPFDVLLCNTCVDASHERVFLLESGYFMHD